MRSGYADRNFNFKKREPFHHGRRYLFTVSNSFPLYLIWQIKYDKTMHSMVESKHFFINPTDAHNYKIIGMLKQLKFRLSLRHVSVHAGTIIIDEHNRTITVVLAEHEIAP